MKNTSQPKIYGIIVDQEFTSGSALSIVFGFLRWRLPKMGNHTAESGIAAGVLLLAIDLLGIDVKPNLIATLLFVIGVLFIGIAADIWHNQKHTEASTSAPKTNEPNKLGAIDDNGGIVTQGQKGNNTISK